MKPYKRLRQKTGLVSVSTWNGKKKLYWEKDGIVPDVIEEIINLQVDTDGEDDTDSACSDSSSADSD